MNIFELQELAAAVLGLTDDEFCDILDGGEDFCTPLLEKLGVDFEQFCEVAEALIKFTPVTKSPLSGEVSHAFVKRIGENQYSAICSVLSKDQGG